LKSSNNLHHNELSSRLLINYYVHFKPIIGEVQSVKLPKPLGYNWPREYSGGEFSFL
jgi:hypothetical protein